MIERRLFKSGKQLKLSPGTKSRYSAGLGMPIQTYTSSSFQLKQPDLNVTTKRKWFGATSSTIVSVSSFETIELLVVRLLDNLYASLRPGSAFKYSLSE
jgi:hypothetical protein